MSEEQDQYQKLQQKLAELQRKQDLFHSEILQIKKEIDNLKMPSEVMPEKPVVKPPEPVKTEEKKPVIAAIVQKTPEAVKKQTPLTTEADYQTSLERFIGENLINKIGIAVTVIGVAIGAKYAIDHDLISPLTRIILGYLVGACLLFFAVRLRKEYANFSAVLLSGSMAIMYFITYAAYSFFGLYPQIITFILMVLFTVFTVTAALKYNKEVIAIIGLVGAYAVPFLLGDNPDAALVLFCYTAIINIGILIIAVKKYWKPLYFSAFALTWLIFLTWYFGSYKFENDFALAFSFLFLFFAIFYLTFLAYKIIQKEKFDLFDILFLLFNSFIYYGIGYSILKSFESGDHYLGLFTLCNAIIHLIVSLVIYRNKLADRNLFYLVSGLFLVFVTIAIPVQFDGSWVTLLWITQAALLFYIGRTKGAPVYEYLSYPLILLSFLSICTVWANAGLESLSKNPVNNIIPVFNIHFLTSLIFTCALGLILYIYLNKKFTSPFSADYALKGFLDYTLSGLFLIVVYLAVRVEISTYWNQLYMASGIETTNNDSPVQTLFNTDLKSFKSIWLVNYSLLYFACLTFINIRYTRNETFGIIIFWLSFVTLLVFLFQNLYLLSELRESYLDNSASSGFKPAVFNVAFRYICFLFAALSLVATKIWMRSVVLTDYYTVVYNLMFHLVILWILSSEMLNIMDLAGNSHNYRFGLSILSGVYSLMLIGLGISGRKRYLRIAAIALFGATLIKLFFYDISKLDTVMKTLLFLALGVLMLIISFLYNKYKKYLFGDDAE